MGPCQFVERVTGIEPAFSAWEADVLPLNYTRETAVENTNPKSSSNPVIVMFNQC